MAGDWMPMRIDLEDDIAVVALSSRIGHTIGATIGALHCAWAWANRNTTDGRMPQITPKHLDERIQIPGFSEAMAAVGWLIIEPNALVFPKYDVWNSNSAKARLVNTQRKKLSRERRASVSHFVGQMRDRCATREEKRREENKEERQAATPPVGEVGSISLNEILDLSEQKAKPRKVKPPDKPPPLPKVLDTPEYRAAWDNWVAYRAQNNTKPYKPLGIAAAWNEHAEWGPERAIAAIKHSMAKGYTGCYEEKSFGRANGTGGSAADARRAAKAATEYDEDIQLRIV
jgi:hypothetical protein